MIDAPPRPRLLVLTSTYPRWRGDTEPGFVHELARRLTDRFDVTVIAPHAAGAARREEMDGVSVRRFRYAPVCLETLVNHGGMLVNVHRARWKWLLVPCFLLGQGGAVLGMLRHWRPAVVHAHWLLPQGLLAACVVGEVPLLVTSHGADLFGLRGRVAAWMRKCVIHRVAALSVVSEAMRQRVQEDVPGIQAEVMPMGVDCEGRFSPDASTREEETLLFVGRLVEKKGLRHLIEAMPVILESRPGVRLDVIGTGPCRAELDQQVAVLGLQEHVRFLGGLSQDALPWHYRHATVFVAPFVEAGNGDQEGLGLVVAEAMACMCPVLVGDVAAVRDLVSDATGVRVDASDRGGLASAIVDLLQDKPRGDKLAREARRHVLRNYAWPAVADRYAQLLHSLADPGAR